MLAFHLENIIYKDESNQKNMLVICEYTIVALSDIRDMGYIMALVLLHSHCIMFYRHCMSLISH